MQIKQLDQELAIEANLLKKAVLVYRAINNKFRLRILNLLIERKQLTVTEIFTALHLEQSVASQHLAALRKAGLVQAKRDGKQIYYSVNEPKIRLLHRVSANLLGNS